MAFPSTSGSKVPLELAWSSLMGHAGRVKRHAQLLRDASLAPTKASLILGTMDSLLTTRDAMQALSTTPGLEAYARAQVNDPALDLAADFSTMIANINAVRDWIVSNVPKDASNYLLIQTIAATGARVDREFNGVSLGGLRTVLDTLIASID